MEQRNHDTLLVTLADRNFIDQAKQLFSSVYWNAGWKGDYMLLAHEIPEKDLKWFRDKGILVKKCKPLYSKGTGNYFYGTWTEYSQTIYSTFYIFKPEFKKWKNIVFLEADMIVRFPLDRLAKLKGFWATDVFNAKLYEQFATGKIPAEIKKTYDLKRLTFNPGIMTFSTEIIKKDSFDKIKKIADKYKDITLGDEGILNLFFYKKWKKLFYFYNLWPFPFNHYYNIPYKKMNAICLHFVNPGTLSDAKESEKRIGKPWKQGNPFFSEWELNLKKSEDINLNKIFIRKKFGVFNIISYSLYLKIIVENLYFFYLTILYYIKEFFYRIIYSSLKEFFYRIIYSSLKEFIIVKIPSFFAKIINFPSRILGIIGQTIKKISPSLYYKLKGKNGTKKS